MPTPSSSIDRLQLADPRVPRLERGRRRRELRHPRRQLGGEPLARDLALPQLFAERQGARALLLQKLGEGGELGAHRVALGLRGEQLVGQQPELRRQPGDGAVLAGQLLAEDELHDHEDRSAPGGTARRRRRPFR